MTGNTSQGGAGGAANHSGGTDSTTNSNSSENGGGDSGGQVSYETHRKLLAEKKRRDEELALAREMIAKHEREAKEREESELRQKEDYKKLLELREKELTDARAEAEAHRRRMAEAQKIDAFLKAVNGTVPDRYWNLIDTDQIVIDPTTGKVDQISVTKAAEAFRANFPEVVMTKGGSLGMPQGAPRGGSGSISYEEWLQLPVAEMKKRMKDVRSTDQR
jgi:hypothetical protein